MAIIPVITKRRKSIIQKFVDTKTTNQDNAKSLEELNLEINKDIEFLLFKGTLKKTKEGKYFLNEDRTFLLKF